MIKKCIIDYKDTDIIVDNSIKLYEYGIKIVDTSNTYRIREIVQECNELGIYIKYMSYNEIEVDCSNLKERLTNSGKYIC